MASMFVLAVIFPILKHQMKVKQSQLDSKCFTISDFTLMLINLPPKLSKWEI